MTQIVAVYTGVLALIFLVLSARTIQARVSQRISLGDGDNFEMRSRMRAHANFAEYVPIILLLMWLMAAQGFSSWVIHALGIATVVARVLHPFGLAIKKSPNPPRFIGATLTLTVLAVAAILVLLAALAGIRV